MRRWEELTPSGQARRLRPSAAEALAAFGIGGARVSLAQHSENTIFRVETGEAEAPPGPYPPGRYALRVHSRDYQTRESIESEMQWLAALHADGLPVPAPVARGDGTWSTVVAAADARGPRVCTLVRWVMGRAMHRPPPVSRYRHIGVMLSRLHEHASRWAPPPGFQRPRWDWDGFFGATIPFAGTVAEECWPLVPQPHRGRWRSLAEEFRQVAADLGEGPAVFGLIHADAHYGNLVYGDGEMRPLDFDDCGWGHYLYDYAVGLGSPQRRGPHWPQVQEAFWSGYAEHRSVPEDTLGALDHFFAARAISVVLWEFGMVRVNPAFAEYLPESLEYVSSLLDIMGM